MKTKNKRIRFPRLLVKNQQMLFMASLFMALSGCVWGQQSGESKSDIDVVEKAIRVFEAEQEKLGDEKELKAKQVAEIAKRIEELDNDELVQFAQLCYELDEYDMADEAMQRLDHQKYNQTNASRLYEAIELYGKLCFQIGKKFESERTAQRFCFLKADRYFSELIETFPKEPKYLDLLAQVQLKYRPTPRAIESYTKAIELAPNCPEYYISRAWHNKESRKEDLSKAATLEPKNYKISYLRAFDARDAKDFSEALKQIDISLRHKPKIKRHLSDLISLRGEVFAHLQDYNQSIYNFRQFLRLNPRNTSGMRKYANALENAKRWSEVVQAYDELALKQAFVDCTL